MKPLTLFLAGVLFFAACKKDSGGSPKITNTNKITATVTVKGRGARSFVSTGADSSFFIRAIDSLRNDTLYTIFGSDGVGSITLTLVGMVASGTYQFQSNDTTGSNIHFASYSESADWWTYSIYQSTFGTDSLGNALSAGAFTIIKMNDDEIEGTMVAEMGNTEGIQVELHDVYFKGVFTK